MAGSYLLTSGCPEPGKASLSAQEEQKAQVSYALLWPLILGAAGAQPTLP